MIQSNPDVLTGVTDSLRGSSIRVSDSAARCDCVVASIDFPGLTALLESAMPVVVVSDRPASVETSAAMVRAGAQDCLGTDQLAGGRLEHAIRTAVQRHVAASSQHGPIWSVRTSGEVFSWNSGAEALFGYSAEQIIGRDVRLLTPATPAADGDGITARVVRGEVAGPFVTECIARDGTALRVSLLITPILDDGGRNVGGCVVARDLRGQLSAEQALVASEERYRRIVETAGEGIAIVDEHHVITFANQRLADMLGYTRDDLLGTYVPELLHPDDVSAAQERWLRAADPPRRVEVRYRRSDGTVVWGLVSRTRQSGSTDPRWLVMVTDITARKAAEHELLEREERFRAVFESASDSIVIADDERRFVAVNPAACRTFGRSREELVGQRIDDVSSPDANPVVESAWTSFNEDGVLTGAWSVVRPDGEVREVEYAATPDISPHRHLSVLRDVTDRNAAAAKARALEHRLHQAERLETVGQLAGGVAHDFNNILAVIVNYAELARTHARDDRSVGEDLDEISAAVARGRDLTRQLLIVSQRDVTQPEVFDLVSLVRSIHKLLKRVIDERICIELRLPREPVAVSADRGRIDQLVMNLALNARDAMPAGGTLSIAVARRSHDEDPSAVGEVELIVADTGVGMSDDVAARAFEPFFTTKPSGQGVGLGLAAATGIVANAGGRISLTSTLQEGTSVVVVLPGTAERPREPDEVAGPPIPDGGGRHVLLVEDDAKLLEGTRRVLEEHGYTTTAAATAEDALACADWSLVDIVLTDLVMPGMSGIGLAQRLRVMHPEIRVVCTSGYSARRGMLPDGVVLLEKPFLLEELLTALAPRDEPR